MLNRGFAAILLILTFAGCRRHPRPPEDSNPRTVYFTVGDNQDLLGLPLDSAASIEATFDVLRGPYRVSRVWWRGGQDEIWGNQFVIRPENRLYARIWDWWRDLQYRKVGTNRIAVRAAHARGLEIWMAYGLFDNGSGPDVGFGGFPYAAEDRLRVEHPDWAPLNRFGTWRQGGPIELAYPEARRAMVDYLARYTLDGGYDGIAFLSYAENYSLRYEDEFGFNAPVVDEFRRRYGVDIRREPFDRAAWARLRGEYVTAFLRELRAALHPAGKKIAVSVDGRDPHLPCLWNVEGGVRTAGRIHLDLETWVREGLVDELNLYIKNTDDALRRVVELCRGSATSVSLFGRTRGELPPKVLRIMTVGPDVESGYPWEHYIDWKDERVTAQPPDALDGGDVLARRRLLHAVSKRVQKIPAGRVAAALRDPDLFVRRQALDALAALGDRSALPGVEAALADAENSVRWKAALALAELGGPEAIDTLLGAVARPESTFQFNLRAVPEAVKRLAGRGALGPDGLRRLLAHATAAEPKVREAALHALGALKLPPSADIDRQLARVARSDAEPYCRELALSLLARTNGSDAAFAAAVAALEDDDPVVQLRAATALGRLGAAAPPQRHDQARGALARKFAAFGGASARPDGAWGWRVIGNALLDLGDDGRAELERVLRSGTPRLAELAWRVLYLRQGDKFYPVTEEQDRAAHALRPASGKPPAFTR